MVDQKIAVSPSIEDLRTLLLPSSLNPDTEAFVQIYNGGEQNRFSRRSFCELTDKAEEFLRNLGIVRGSSYVISSPNCPELAALILASFRLGALVCPIDFRLTQNEILNVANSLKASLVILNKKINPDFEATTQFFANNQITLSDLNLIHNACIPAHSERHKNPTDFDSLDAPAFMILTSGTTGLPKAAVHSLRTLLLNIRELGEMAKLSQRMHILLPAPLSHVLGLEVLLAALLFDSPIIFPELSINSIIQCAVTLKPEILVGVPTIYGAFLSAGLQNPNLDLSHTEILLCGGAPLPLTLATDFEKHFGKRINNGYGSTESKIIAVNFDGPRDAVGKLVPSAHVKILDNNNQELPEGETGEVYIGGPFLMQGYFANEAATKEALIDGYYKTGDLGRLENGYLFISGRAKELIIVAGNKVFPAEVEGVLMRHPLSREVAVVGPAHSKLGQIVKAHIVLNDGEYSEKLLNQKTDEEARANKQELAAIYKAFCQEHLKRELRPMEYQFYPSAKPLPKTLTGKIDKKDLQ